MPALDKAGRINLAPSSALKNENSDSESLLPLLRWAGSKKRQFVSFQAFFPSSYNKYVEPFAGSAAFFFCLRPKVARLNDLNRNVVDFYRNCRRSPSEFYDTFASIPRSERRYYTLRDEFNASPRSKNRSILFYYLNRNCFNGIHRTNRSGEFNVPFSSSRVSPYIGKKTFVESVGLLSRAKITNSDFEKFCTNNVERDDFVYLDPPYFKLGQRIFNEYNAFPFADEDFDRLKRTLKMIDKRGAKFLLTFASSELTMALAKSWKSTSLSVTRSVAGDPAKRGKQVELLIYNYD